LGEARARTRNWRARMYGRLASRTLMNQVYYPNLIKLGELAHPFTSTDPRQPDQPDQR
jgi:hypothetical protein